MEAVFTATYVYSNRQNCLVFEQPIPKFNNAGSKSVQPVNGLSVPYLFRHAFFIFIISPVIFTYGNETFCTILNTVRFCKIYLIINPNSFRLYKPALSRVQNIAILLRLIFCLIINEHMRSVPILLIFGCLRFCLLLFGLHLIIPAGD